MTSKDLNKILTFFRNTERLKNTIRSARTSEGRQESVAEHTWRLCLMAVIFERYFPDVDFPRLIKICIIHDLGEAIHGDIPAPKQTKSDNKSETERRDLLKLLEDLPTDMQDEIIGLWDEYETASTPAARLAKALDKLETILQHNQGENPDHFNYQFNLEYGQQFTSYHPLIAAIREKLDRETRQRSKDRDS